MLAGKFLWDGTGGRASKHHRSDEERRRSNGLDGKHVKLRQGANPW
jgi:hypothetical protein